MKFSTIITLLAPLTAVMAIPIADVDDAVVDIGHAAVDSNGPDRLEARSPQSLTRPPTGFPNSGTTGSFPNRGTTGSVGSFPNSNTIASLPNRGTVGSFPNSGTTAGKFPTSGSTGSFQNRGSTRGFPNSGLTGSAGRVPNSSRNGIRLATGLTRSQCDLACDAGGDTIEQFCRGIPEGTPARQACWIASTGSEAACHVFCQIWFG